VIALRTCAQNELRAAQEFVTFSKGNQKSTFFILADQKFFHAVSPLANGLLWNRERSRSGPKFGIRPRILYSFFNHKVQSNHTRSAA